MENKSQIKLHKLHNIITKNSLFTQKSNFLKWKSKSKKNQQYKTYYPSNVKIQFIDRQEEFIQKRKENKRKIETKKEDELKELYTFTPKVNVGSNLHRRNDLSPFERLYRNDNNKYKKKNSLLQEFKGSKRTSIEKRTNKKAIDKLYNDHKEKEQKKKNLQKEIDKERGLTFKPKSFTYKSGYNVESNFEERNKKLIEDRQNFVFVYDYLRQSKYNEKVLGNKADMLMKNYLENTKMELENLVQSQKINNYVQNSIQESSETNSKFENI